MPRNLTKKAAYDVQYIRDHDNIMIRPSKDKGGAIRAAAAAAGQSVQAYVIQACFERMQRDSFTPLEATDADQPDT